MLQQLKQLCTLETSNLCRPRLALYYGNRLKIDSKEILTSLPTMELKLCRVFQDYRPTLIDVFFYPCHLLA